MPRRALTATLVGGVLVVAVACGGPAFSVASGDDASAGNDNLAPDVGSSSDTGLSSDVGPDSRPGDATLDGLDDAAGIAMDATWQPDVFEEPPPHCGGSFACAPGVPSGWSGPLELYAGSGGAPSCTANFAGPSYDGNDVLSAQPAACFCQCGSPQAVQCSSPTVSFYEATGTTGCTAMNFCGAIILTPGGCTGVNIVPRCPIGAVTSTSMTVGASIPSNGSCMPVPKKSVPGFSWATTARACLSALGAAHSDCAAGSVCAPLPAPPFPSSLCIAHPGDTPCPSVGYSAKHLYYGAALDSRDCSVCSCGAVTGATCAASVNVFSSNLSCSGGAISYIPPFTCAAVQQPADFRLDLLPSNGSCAPSPTLATGTTTPSSPTTFCCSQ